MPMPSPSSINKHFGGGCGDGLITKKSTGDQKMNNSWFSTSRLSTPMSSPHIADDIRSDNELVFADDNMEVEGPLEVSLPPPSLQSRTPVSPLGGPSQRRGSSLSVTSSFPASRRTSQKAIEELQREVDMALELFSQEAADLSDDEFMTNEEHFQPLHKGDGVRFHMSGGECDDSYPSTAATSLSPSESGDDTDCHDPTPSTPTVVVGGLSLRHKTKSLLSLPLSLLPSRTKMNCVKEEEECPSAKFHNVVSEGLHVLGINPDQHSERTYCVDFDSNHSLRNAMEPFLCVARLKREEARRSVFNTLDKVMLPQERATRRASTSMCSDFHIGSNFGVPYPSLRNELRFLYDLETYPLDKVLADTLGVSDLSRLHLDRPRGTDKGELMSPLRNRALRRRFHQLFDSFVTGHVIPLLHSQALSKGIFHTNRHQLHRGKIQTIVYRYQAFPTVNIVRPGEASTDPHCDMALGHSIGNISFHVPLTSTFGTNAVYAESRPGREDWHPLATKSPGLGFQFDGARCLHFNLKNETDITRVGLNFSVAITRACGVEYDPDDQLCPPELLKDRFSLENPDYYEEVEVSMGDVQSSFLPRPVAERRRSTGVSIIG